MLLYSLRPCLCSSQCSSVVYLPKLTVPICRSCKLHPLSKLYNIMSFSVDALQSLSRQRNIHSQRNRETMTTVDDESVIIAAGRRLLQKFKRTVTRQDRRPIVATIGQAVKNLANTVSNVINGIWQRRSRSKYRVFLDDVIVDGRDRPNENDSVKVALLSKVPIPRNRPTELIAKKNERMLGVSMPIEIPKGRRQRPKPKRRDLNVA